METVLEQVSEISSGEQNESLGSATMSSSKNSNNVTRYVRARKGRDVWGAISTFGGKDEKRRMRKMKNLSKAYMYGFGSFVFLLVNRGFDVIGIFAESSTRSCWTWIAILSIGMIVARVTSRTFREPWYVSGFFVVPMFAWCACFSRLQLGTNDPADGFLFACAAINTCFAIFDSRKPKSFRYATAEQRKLLGLPELSDEDIEFDRAEMPKSIVRDGDTSVETSTTTKSSNLFSGSTSVLPSSTSTATTSATTPLSSRSTLLYCLIITHFNIILNIKTGTRLAVTPIQSGSRWQSTSLGLENDISIVSNVSDLDELLDVSSRVYHLHKSQNILSCEHTGTRQKIRYEHEHNTRDEKITLEHSDRKR